jgi:hypothetical protein
LGLAALSYMQELNKFPSRVQEVGFGCSQLQELNIFPSRVQEVGFGCSQLQELNMFGCFRITDQALTGKGHDCLLQIHLILFNFIFLYSKLGHS